MFRYVALIWPASDTSRSERAARLVRRLRATAADWRPVLDAPGLQILCTGAAAGASRVYPLARQTGVVLGTLFRTADCTPPTHQCVEPVLDDVETDRILATRGRALIDAYWGRYVAFVRNSNEGPTWLIKDPIGRLPCYVGSHDGMSVVFSYMPDYVALAPRPLEINWRYVAARVALGGGRPDDTGMKDVAELCGGEYMSFNEGRSTRYLYWDPATRVGGEMIDDPILAAQTLRARTKACIHAWASRHETLIHRLSGGLDSSIVLACLADAPSRPRVICLTYGWSGSASSERPWARLAAEASECQHFEQARDPRLNFDALSRMTRSPSPPPTASFLETDRIEREFAAQHGATAISSGDGGDSLFGSTAARFALADYWHRRGFRPTLLRIASDVALLRNQTVWHVLATSLRQGLFKRGDAQQTRLLREGRALVCADTREPLLANLGAFRHPWFRSGRVSRSISEILSFLTTPDLYYDPISGPEDRAEPIFPLLSQPLVEVCMSIPSDVHFERGRDRGLARRAFADDVPAPILTRTWKDRVQGFPEDILRTNLEYFRSMLLDGILVSERYLDRAAVETALSGTAVTGLASVGEILDHVLVETWLRSWRGSAAGRATT